MNLKYQIKIKSLHKESVKLYINFLQKMLRNIKVNFSIIALPENKKKVDNLSHE